MTLSQPLSMQLYSARKFPPVATQLATIRQCGFTDVETFGPFYDDVAETRRLLDVHGLSARSGHFALAMTEQEPERVVAMARTLGVEIVVVPYLAPSERPGDVAGWADLGRRLAGLSARFADEGLRLAWHNHDFRVRRTAGRVAADRACARRRSVVGGGLAWVVRGGGDPARWVETYRGRIPLVHVKDIARDGESADEDGWADVGAGVLPWHRLWPLCVAAGRGDDDRRA